MTILFKEGIPINGCPLFYASPMTIIPPYRKSILAPPYSSTLSLPPHPCQRGSAQPKIRATHRQKHGTQPKIHVTYAKVAARSPKYALRNGKNTMHSKKNTLHAPKWRYTPQNTRYIRQSGSAQPKTSGEQQDVKKIFQHNYLHFSFILLFSSYKH